jgi:hypothetical protein
MATRDRKRTRTQSTAARQAASSREVRQRRRAQRRRQFAQTWQQLESRLSVNRQWLPAFGWRRMHLRMPGFSGFHASKLLSLLLLLAVASALYAFQEDESFFVYQENVTFVNMHYLTKEELYEYCDIESWSVLWIDPALIRTQILAHPYVADAQVDVQWPAHVNVTVTEVVPTALWSTDQGVFWVLEDGSALPVRGDQAAPVLNIVDPEFAARAPGADNELYLQKDILAAAQSLAAQLPGLDTVRYNRTHGLNFGIAGTQTWIYWGDGERFDEKWLALQSALPEINADRSTNQTFSVIAPNRPYFRYYADTPKN